RRSPSRPTPSSRRAPRRCGHGGWTRRCGTTSRPGPRPPGRPTGSRTRRRLGLVDPVDGGLLGAGSRAVDARVRAVQVVLAASVGARVGVVVRDESPRACGVGPIERVALPDVGLLLAEAPVHRLAVALLPRGLAPVVRPRAVGRRVALVESVLGAPVV